MLCTQTEQTFDQHIDWVNKVARIACRSYGLSTDGEQPDFQDVAQTGLLAAWRYWEQFQPEPGCTDLEGAYRGYAYRAVLTFCQRECERILNGGTYHARRRTARDPVICRQFSVVEGVDMGEGYEPKFCNLTRNQTR